MKLKLLPLLVLAGLTTGCQMGYVMKSGYGQMKLLSSRVPLEQALKDPQLGEAKRRKLMLAQEARIFAESTLHLKETKNYTSYAELGRPYVTYVVSAAPKWNLTHHEWSYPLMGKMPYKGFFDEAEAKAEEASLQKDNLDTYLRGVSAYSTLGWFNDPVLSSMLGYEDYDLVNTIIHELVHATLYIKHAADFNERLATFMGNKGAELFYLKKEGTESPTLKKIQLENEDHRLFSQFISRELQSLEDWYKQLPANKRSDEGRKERIRQIQSRFQTEVAPFLKTESYIHFPKIHLNNARLLIYKTYMQDLSDFEKLYEKTGRDFVGFLQHCRQLESSKNPAQKLKDLLAHPQNQGP